MGVVGLLLSRNLAHTRGSSSRPPFQDYPGFARRPQSLESNASNSSSTASSAPKRTSSRLRDPELAAKHKAFLQKVTVATNGSMESFLEQEANKKMETPALKRKAGAAGLSPAMTAAEESKRRRSARNNSSGQDATNDSYCWICHKEGDVICCETCPRVFHLKCIPLENAPTEDWVCPECVLIMTAENMDTRSRAMRLLNVDNLCTLLKHALTRIRSITGIDPFILPVDTKIFPAYRDYITCPMDLQTIEKNIRKKQYGSTEAFLADTKWVLHNCIVFNTTGSKLTSIAKTLVKVCKHEMQEIENCPDCYINAHTKKDSWFVAACRIPHLLVWAKLKGFPFWPGKAMRVNSEEQVDVRFFGAHDRAWIPIKDVYLYSEEAPVSVKNKKKGNLEACVTEVEKYLKNITDRFGAFAHAPPKTQLDQRAEEEQIKLLYPKCSLPFELGPIRRRARAYSFSGSERSQADTPTPSDAEDINESQTILEAKTPLAESHLAQEEEELINEPLPTEDAEKKDKVEGETKPKNATDASRSAISPPCEVSSTTQNAETKRVAATIVAAEEKAKEETKKDDTKAAAVTEEPKKTKVAIIAETSETVELEGEIDDDEEATLLDQEIPETDNVDPVPSKDAEKTEEEPEKKKAAVSDKIGEADFEDGESEIPPPKALESEPESEEVPMETDEPATEKESAKEAPKSAESVSSKPASDEEIDDVEPEVEEITADDDTATEEEEAESVDASALFGSGISVSVVEKKTAEKVASKVPTPPKIVPPVRISKELVKDSMNAPSKSSSPATTPTPAKTSSSVANGLGLGSDISVTVVPKKKKAEDPAASTATKTSSPVPPAQQQASAPKLKLKKESELLKGTTGRANNTAKTAKKPSNSNIPRDSIDLTDDGHHRAGKSPPDPIVTISKVQGSKSDPPKQPQLPSQPIASIASALSRQQAPPNRVATSSPATSMARALSGGGRSLLRPPSHPPPSSGTPPGSLASILSGARPPGLPGYRNGPGGMPMPSGMPNRPGLMPGARMRMSLLPPDYRGPHPPPTGPMGMPSLHPRPGGPLSGPGQVTPPQAGPVSEQLAKVSSKLADYMRLSLEDIFREMATSGSAEAQIKTLQIELEKMQWRHQQEIQEVKHNTELIIQEMRASVENDKQKAIGDVKKQMELEKQKAITETKKKQWCAQCGKEAIFYCCWNTSYCDYPCQQSHWPSHMSTCSQNQSNQEEEGSGDHGVDPTAHAQAQAQAQSHFMSSQEAAAAAAMTSRQARNVVNQQALQNGVMNMPPHGINPRMMSQMGLRFPGGMPRAPLPPGNLRFPGPGSGYFM